MADFELAYRHTSNKEGGYVNDPSDYGRETYRGISRRWHPYWEGWKIVDEEKANTHLRDLTRCLNQRQDLQKLVKTFYKETFWNVHRLDLVPDQVLAECIFDTGFHLGAKDAVLILQRALNVTNAQGKYYPDLIRDGDLGPVTLRAISRHRYPAILLSVFNILRGYYFVQRMEEDPSQERFIGWFNRLRWNP